MKRIITFNANGIRSAERKGFFTWVLQQNAEVICLQETKAYFDTLDHATFCPPQYHCYYANAEKKGYSGVALYCRQKPKCVSYSWGCDISDREGRYVEADFGHWSVISLYMPSGTTGEERQAIKYEFMQKFLEYLKKLRKKDHLYLICGDWNIAHKTIDLKNWRANQKHSGFLPDERAWMDRVLSEHAWVDAFRVVNQASDQYTWWSHRGMARAKNVGWRIDYQIVSPTLSNKIKSANIYTKQIFSDHAPLIVDYDF